MTSLWPLMMVVCSVTAGGGFEQAIDAARCRTVKLYGLGAGQQEGYGSGILVSEDGQVLTVLSILVDSDNIRAVTADGTRYAAAVTARDTTRHMALLQLAVPNQPDTPISGLPCFKQNSPASPAALSPGDWVVASGNSFQIAEGAEPVSVALGVFSGRARLDARRRRQDYTYPGDVLLLDAITSNPGLPGGPVVDLEGNWVGMVGRVAVSNATHTQLNHAFPVYLCHEFLREARHPELRASMAESRRQEGQHGVVDVGIRLFELGYRKKLVFVERVVRSSPAALAGLKSDDLIVSANGRSVPDLAAFRRVLDTVRPGDTVQLVVIRDDQHHTITIELDAQP